MDKSAFIERIRGPLKERGYRKKGFYWYKKQNDLLLCVNVQGSQWDGDDYYVNIGGVLTSTGKESPTLLKWAFNHRCTDKTCESNADVSILPEVMFEEMDLLFSELNSAADLPEFYQKHRVVRILDRYEIL